MWKTACLILAAGLIFPLLAFSAAQPDEPPAVPPEEDIPAASGDVQESVTKVLSELMARLNARGGNLVEMPDSFNDLTLEQQRFVWQVLEQRASAERYLEEQRALRQRSVCLAAGEPGDSLCAAAAAITRMEPCLAAGDCPAVEAWEQAMGQMGIVQAPQTMTRASERPATRVDRPEPGKD